MAAIKAVGSILQGVGEMKAHKQNALNAEAEGEQAVATSGAEAMRIRRQVAGEQASLIAGAGAQGTTFAGSPMEVYTENALQGETMAQDRIYGGRLVNRSKRMEAQMSRRKASGAMLGGIFGALGAGASAWAGSSGN
jgi:hypothetical protein